MRKMINLEGAEIFLKETGGRVCVNKFLNQHWPDFGRNYIDALNNDDIYLSRSTNRLDRDDKEIFTGMIIDVYCQGLHRVDYDFYGEIVLISEDRGDEIDLIKASWVSDYRVVGSWLKKGMK